MRRERPGLFRVIYDGVHLTPTARFAQAMRDELMIGREYTFERILERSMKSHAHYMANVNEGWKNLREDMRRDFPTPTHLRTKALIETGWATYIDQVFDTHPDARNGAALVQALDEYCFAEVRGNVVRVWRAMSQAVSAMDNKDFQASKDDVLSYISGLLQVSKSSLEKQAGSA